MVLHVAAKAGSSATDGGKRIDVGQIIDQGGWTAVQRLLVILAASSIVLDGFDGQLIGFAIPMLMDEWGVSKADFAPVVATGLVGMAVGSGLAGYAADRFGRRMALIASVFTFGIATIAIGFAPNIWSIAVLRFLAGLGIGGALPTSTTIAAEFTPTRHRTMAITATIVCVPLGGMLAGVFSSFVLPLYGWRTLFHIGGAIPLVFAFVLLAKLPESPRWLVRHRSAWDSLSALLQRMGHVSPAGAEFFDSAENQKATSKTGLRAILEDGRAFSTFALWVAFFLTLLSVYLAFSWLPTMLTSEGLSVAVAGSGLTAYNLGGVFGALLCAVAIKRFGSRFPLVICCLGAALSAFMLRGLNAVAQTDMLIIGLGLHGMFVNAVQSTMYAVAANLYPTHVRATGTAAGLVIGRMGAIVSAFVGASVIASGGGQSYLTLLTVAMLGSGIALLLLRKHIAPDSWVLSRGWLTAPLGRNRTG